MTIDLCIPINGNIGTPIAQSAHMRIKTLHELSLHSPFHQIRAQNTKPPSRGISSPQASLISRPQTRSDPPTSSSPVEQQAKRGTLHALFLTVPYQLVQRSIELPTYVAPLNSNQPG